MLKGDISTRKRVWYLLLIASKNSKRPNGIIEAEYWNFSSSENDRIRQPNNPQIIKSINKYINTYKYGWL